jgi:hypothetical protein
MEFCHRNMFGCLDKDFFIEAPLVIVKSQL